MTDMNNKLFPNEVREYLFHNVSSISSSTAVNHIQFSCYDDYYCNGYSLARTGHVFLGVIGLMLSLFGLALNVLLIPVLSLVGIRSSATYYMIGIAISDCCFLIINVMLVVIRYLPSDNQTDQLLIYQNYVAYLVPFGLPLKFLCQTLTTSLCASLILDRIVYLKTESRSNTAKRAVAVKVIITVVTLTIIYKLPNFLVYKIVENYSSGITVKWTMLSKSWIFIADTTMLTTVYGILVVSTCVLWHLVVTYHFLPKTLMLKLVHFEVPPSERFHRRERLYIMISLIVAVSTAILKFPHVFRNMIFGFSMRDRDFDHMHKLAVADVWMEISDIVLVALKPCIYLSFAVHFRQALQDMIGLLVRPSRYSVLKASGGMGKSVDVSKKLVNGINRSDTSNTLLHSNSDNRLNDMKYPTAYVIDIEALAETRVNNYNKMNNNGDSNSSQISACSSISLKSTINSGLIEGRLKF